MYEYTIICLVFSPSYLDCFPAIGRAILNRAWFAIPLWGVSSWGFLKALSLRVTPDGNWRTTWDARNQTHQLHVRWVFYSLYYLSGLEVASLFVCLFWCFWATPGRLPRPHGMPGMELRSATYRVNALPTGLSIWSMWWLIWFKL